MTPENGVELSESGSEPVNPPSQVSQEVDYSQGYEIRLCVYKDGFQVKGPLPLPQIEDEDEAERISDLPTALKHVIAIAKENPIDEDMQSHFSAGYEGE